MITSSFLIFSLNIGLSWRLGAEGGRVQLFARSHHASPHGTPQKAPQNSPTGPQTTPRTSKGGLLGGCHPLKRDTGYFWQPYSAALQPSRKGGREGRKEGSTAAAQTLPAQPRTCCGVEGRAPDPWDILQPHGPQRASLGNGGQNRHGRCRVLTARD